MKRTTRNALVLGANGFLGWNATVTLLRNGWSVRALDASWDSRPGQDLNLRENIEIVEASVQDQALLRKAMKGIDTVFNFVSFSVPSTMPEFLRVEIHSTVNTMNTILEIMVEEGPYKIVFPSSGGTIYGDLYDRAARESDPACPLSSYGFGKYLCEQIILFYERIYKINYTIMRISNAYGTDHISRSSQGFIDVFLERILLDKPLLLWGNGEQIRDFIFIDDVMEAMMSLLALDASESTLVNIGSGVGIKIKDAISIIERVVGRDLDVEMDPTAFSGISYSVMDIRNIQKISGWSPKTSLIDGIEETWRRKKQNR